MRGLDPRIHDEVQRAQVLRPCMSRGLMDGRVKPGHDGEGGWQLPNTPKSSPSSAVRGSGDPDAREDGLRASHRIPVSPLNSGHAARLNVAGPLTVTGSRLWMGTGTGPVRYLIETRSAWAGCVMQDLPFDGFRRCGGNRPSSMQSAR
jgi:hypothetical protein